MSVESVRTDASQPLGLEDIRGIVLAALRNVNLSRDPAAQLQVSDQAPIFGPESPLDSLGLVALLLDIEDELAANGCPVLLSDDRAMSQKRSPFRTVESLVDYIQRSLQL